jgi:hypothetical protein
MFLGSAIARRCGRALSGYGSNTTLTKPFVCDYLAPMPSCCDSVLMALGSSQSTLCQTKCILLGRNLKKRKRKIGMNFKLIELGWVATIARAGQPPQGAAGA